MHPTSIEIDVAQFRKNLQIIRKAIGNTLFCLPVKANAYGHGLCEMSRIAIEEGIDYLGVSCLQEGIELRQAGIKKPILVFGAIHESQIDALIHYALEFSISSRYKAQLVARSGKPCRVHLEMETGMQRTGMRPETAIALFREMGSMPQLEIVGIYSHLASSEIPNDPVAREQIDIFTKALSHFPNQIAHIANSGGVLFFPDAYHHMVRPGLLSYGYLPSNAPLHFQGIAPCFSLKSKIAFFKVVPEGSGISYGHRYKTQKQTRIVTVPIGYGDGYLRAPSNRAEVLIRGKRYPIAGNICMDQFMVDIGENVAYVGDEVVLFGKQGTEAIALAEIASICNTVTYEILCLLNNRIPRVYL